MTLYYYIIFCKFRIHFSARVVDGSWFVYTDAQLVNETHCFIHFALCILWSYCNCVETSCRMRFIVTNSWKWNVFRKAWAEDVVNLLRSGWRASRATEEIWAVAFLEEPEACFQRQDIEIFRRELDVLVRFSRASALCWLKK